jgi:ribosomal protein L40E
VQDLSCPKCNSPNPPSAKFCYKCGWRLTVPKESVRKKTPFLTHRVQYWLFTIAFSMFVLLLSGGAIWYLVSLNAKIIDFSFELNAVRNLDKPQVTYSGRISDRELQKILTIAQSFSNPNSRKETRDIVGPDTLLANPSRYKNRTVIVVGQLSRNAEVETIFENDWSTAYVLGIWANGKEIPVIYRGDGERLKPGDFIQVEGVFIDDGKGIHADKVIRLEADPAAQERERLWLLRASIVVFLWLVFCTSVFLWRAFRKSWFSRFSASALLILLLSVLTGCTMDFVTIINPDGSVIMTTTFARSKEDIDFLRQAPGMSGYLDSWITNLRHDGLLAENYQIGDREIFFLQREFGSLKQLSTAETIEGVGSWTYVTKYIEGDKLIFRAMALVDTTVLYSDLTNLNSSAAAEIQKELDSSFMSYTFVLPGNVTYHNGNLLNNHRIEWKLRLNDRNELIAESELPLTNVIENQVSVRNQIIHGLLLIAGASTLVLIFGIVHYRIPKGREK